MNENGAPKKIYLYPSDRGYEEYEEEWGDRPWGEDCVEYTRTDAFIEKASTWLREQKEMVGVSLQDDFIERFKDYMKGE